MTFTLEQIYEVFLLALVIWREARGETLAAKLAVAWVVRNRVQRPGWWGKDWGSVVLKPFQFSSFNHNDPNATRWPDPLDTSWEASLQIAADVYVPMNRIGTVSESRTAGHGQVRSSVSAGRDHRTLETGDPTSGAVYYFDKSLDNNPPAWAIDGSTVHTADIGNLHFYARANG